MMRLSILAAVVLSVLCSCNKGVEPVQEEALVSIKMAAFSVRCTGYCASEITINPTNAIYVEWAPQDPAKFPERSRTVAITAEEWDALARSVTPAALAGLDGIMDCPCTVNGGETLEIRSGGKVRRVTFEHGATLPPVQDLLAQARAIQDRARP